MFLILETTLLCSIYHMGVNTHNCKIVILFFDFFGGGGGCLKKSLTFAASLVLKITQVLNKGLPVPVSPPAGGISALQRQYASQIQYS